MDHALVKYNVPAVTQVQLLLLVWWLPMLALVHQLILGGVLQLIYDAFVDFLTATKGFDASIFTKFDPTFW